MKLVLAFLLAFIVSCSESGNKSKVKSIVGQQFLNSEMRFSNPYPMFIGILQLKKPALLEKMNRQDGRKVIDQTLLDEINQEQDEMISALKSVSPDIKILYRYKRVINGLTIVAPISSAHQIERLYGVKSFEADQQFASPQILQSHSLPNLIENIKTVNSVSYIKATNVHKNIKVIEPILKDGKSENKKVAVKGKGIRVGVIDTGVDYTHSMLGGTGLISDYEAVDRFGKSDFFPNEKVVGGKDFVGKDFSTFTVYFDKFLPKPDINPIDVGGHGTHVAGTVAGVGDGENTYSGVAPEADVYALKVFGDEDGGTSDSVVLAAFEYAMDPNEDFNFDDHLHVLNLSLGSGYGTDHQFYSYAIENLTDFGVIVVASAGNSGDVDYITGSPGSSSDALSVAAGIDNMPHNWKFGAVEFSGEGIESLKVRALEAGFTVKISDVLEAGTVINESLVHVGEAKNDFPDDIKEKLAGKIALIDRGSVSFTEKFKRAQNAGAIAVVVVNNNESEPIVMGGDDKNYEFKIPGIMVSKKIGDLIKNNIKTTKVNFTGGDIVEVPELIGTITSFSSKGPRSLDSILKPEITAPGQQIISASVGTGNKGVRLNGTSMSAPHMAGVMALMRQKYKDLSSRYLKSMVMGTSEKMYFEDKSLSEDEDQPYLLSRQGAGMVNALRAIQSVIATEPYAISLGEHSLIGTKNITEKLMVKNITNRTLDLKLNYVGDSEIIVSFAQESVSLPSYGTTEVELDITLTINPESSIELNGSIEVLDEGQVVFSIPVMAIANQASQIKLSSYDFTNDIVNSSQELNLLMSNSSPFSGKLLPYNLLALDERKQKKTSVKSNTCDLQAVGFKYTTREQEEHVTINDKTVTRVKKINVLKFAIKTYGSLTDWHQCVVNVEFDTNLDGKSDLLLLSGRLDRLPFNSPSEAYVSYLVDSKKRHELVAKNFKDNISEHTSRGVSLDLTDAIVSQLSAQVYPHSTIYELEVDARKVGIKNITAMRVSLSNVYGSDVEESDLLVGGTDAWNYLNIKDKKESFMNLPKEILIEASTDKFLSLVMTNSSAKNPLMLLMPQNKFNFSRNINDTQMVLVNP